MSETVTLREHLEALRAADDRRYAEVAIEREKALRIKETGDRDALQLAREIQTYKDEKANELREQINRERGLYITKDELHSVIREIQAKMEPITAYVTGAQGRSQGISLTTGTIISLVMAAAAVVAIIVAFGGFAKVAS